MPDVSVPWGSGELKVSLPRHWRVQQVALPNLRPAPSDWPDRLARALGQPIGDATLAGLAQARRHGKVAIVVEDFTRQSPLERILPIIVRELCHAGVDNTQIEIFFAGGMHPPVTARQAAARLGPELAGLAWRSNHCQSRTGYVCVGAAEGIDSWVDQGVADADLRIIVSSVSPHLQAGFGGGHKMIFPGCAHLETIRGLHRLGVGRRARQLVGTDPTVNRMRRVIDAAGELLDQRHGRTFAVQYLLDESDQPAYIAAGDVLPTHRMTAKQCAVACGVVVSDLGDVLLVNAHPRDFDLWQSFKCIANTRWAARPNGAILCLARCAGGLHGMQVPRWPIGPTWTRRAVRWLGPDAISSMVTRAIPRLAGDAAFFVRMAAQTIRRNPVFMVSPELHRCRVRFPAIRLFGDVDTAVAAVGEYLGGGSQRVVVFPAGGTTFPVPTAVGSAETQ